MTDTFAYQPGNEFEGKVALVTGSSRNIGRCVALALAAGGAKVAVHARASLEEAQGVAAQIRDAGGDAEAFLADHADKDQIEALCAAVLQRFGGIDILVLNAAVRIPKPLPETTWEDWRNIMAIDLDSTFIYTMACLPSMIERGGGSIVTFGGANALSGNPGRAHVAVAKHGLVGFTKAAAHDLVGYNIRVNLVSPGEILDDAETDPTRGGSRVPMKRQGLPEEIASVVRFLCGPGGSYMTGQTLHVNGGVVMP